MTRADREAIAKYLRGVAAEFRVTHHDLWSNRVPDKEIRAEIAQLRKWAKMLREDT